MGSSSIFTFFRIIIFGMNGDVILGRFLVQLSPSFEVFIIIEAFTVFNIDRLVRTYILKGGMQRIEINQIIEGF